MTDAALSQELVAKVHKLFPQHADLVIARLQSECGGTPYEDERVRCAVLKLSQGSLEKLSQMIDTANQDWRDVLVFAGFGDDIHAHKKWLGISNYRIYRSYLLNKLFRR